MTFVMNTFIRKWHAGNFTMHTYLVDLLIRVFVLTWSIMCIVYVCCERPVFTVYSYYAQVCPPPEIYNWNAPLWILARKLMAWNGGAAAVEK
jgi:hypothetical protein